jgi:hypothetical protein
MLQTLLDDAEAASTLPEVSANADAFEAWLVARRLADLDR